ncbi:PIG-L deacetylase family protein [Streptomyces sp. NPDC052236]|uniref:PIG-L deacetylase family protein n=1 Tax=Streptomyces sp. NPDC052236 TaxID=3365686 RepID=UPI0037D126AC
MSAQQKKRRERVLAVAAHADDETLGAGGTLATHAAAGSDLCLLILSTSALSRPGADHAAVNAHRRSCAQQVAALYGAQLHLEDLPDNQFDTRPLLDVTRRIESVIADFAPTLVYTHAAADLSRDHQITAHATAAATRPQPGTSVRTVLAYEVPSATGWGITTAFRPTWHQPLSTHAVKVKMQALRIYDSEMRRWPHSRSVEAIRAQLAHRGAHVGVNASEAFEVIRHMA